MINYFYHQRIRKTVAIFGTIFNNMYILRKNSSGETISQVKVPLSYAPKRDFIDRIAQTINGEEAERLIAVKLPRMSFEITNIAYDGARQLPKVNSSKYFDTDGEPVKFPSPVPYTVSFQLNVYAKSQDDALQVVEQIMPYFNPHYTLTIKPFTQVPSYKEDIPLTLNSVTFSDDYDGALESRRTIIYTLDFDMKVVFYPFIKGLDGTDRDKLIQTLSDSDGEWGGITLNFGMIQGDDLIKNVKLEIDTDPTNIIGDSDFAFSETWTDL